MATKGTQQKVAQNKPGKTWVRLGDVAKHRVETWATAMKMSVSALLSKLILEHLPEVPEFPRERAAGE